MNRTNKNDTGKIVHGECVYAWLATVVTFILSLTLFYISTSPISHNVDMVYADIQSGKITSEYTSQFAQRYDIVNKEYSRLEIYLGLVTIALDNHFNNVNNSSTVLENSSAVLKTSSQTLEFFSSMTKYSGVFQKMLLENLGNEAISLLLSVISLLLGCIPLWLELNKVFKKDFNHTSYYFKKHGATSFILANHVDSIDITAYFNCTFVIDAVLCILISWFLIIEEYRAKVTLGVVSILFVCLLVQNIHYVYSLRLGILLYWVGIAIPIAFSCMYSMSSCKSVFWLAALTLWLVLCLAWRKTAHAALSFSLPTTNREYDFRIQANGEWLDNANWDIYIVKLPHKSKALVRQKNGEIKEYTVTEIAVPKTRSKHHR